MSRNSHDHSLHRRKSSSAFAAKVFKESTVSVISSIISAPNRPRKLLKTVVLLFCLIGFLYQTSTFIYYVLQYETVLNLDIEKPEYIDVPAYTFCDNNGIRRKVFCSTFPERCFQPDEEFCKAHPFYCGSNKMLVPRQEYYFMEFNMTLNEILRFSKNISDLLVENDDDFNAEADGPYLWPKNADEQGRSACYSLHLLVDSPLDTIQSPVSFLFKKPINRLKFALEEDDSFLPDTRPGILFAIHSPFQAVNPFTKGFFLKAGRTYNIHIAMDKEILLPYPYATNCLNYTKEWEARNKSGPRTQETCQHKCVFDVTMKYYNCTASMTVYPNNAPLCTVETLIEIQDNEVGLTEVEYCIEQCKDDCSKMRYYPVIQERFTIKYNEDGEVIEDSKKFVYVNIYLEEEEVIVLRRRPQYMSVEVYSNIGGFIGVWLGVSLVQLMDFFETMGRIIIHFFKAKISS